MLKQDPAITRKNIDHTQNRRPWRFCGLQKGAKNFELLCNNAKYTA
jgi:hypothetical protein